MKKVDKTYEVLAWKQLNRDVDEKWSDWALEMLTAGFETEHLIELAGISKPYNQFELKELTDRVFEELGLDISDETKIINQYASYLVNLVLNGKRDLLPTLNILKDLCIETDYNTKLYDFYSLYFAKNDLNLSDMQMYWSGANRENIDSICLDYFSTWLKKNPLENE